MYALAAILTPSKRRTQMDNLKTYIVTMKDGPDFFKELVFAEDCDNAKEVAELKYDLTCVNARRAACRVPYKGGYR